MPNLALIDDHTLMRNGMCQLVQSLGHTVAFEAASGLGLQQQLNPFSPPDLILMDINMPEMDGYQTTQWLRDTHPAIPVLALSMYDKEEAIIKMLKAGAKGYILKDSEPAELQSAIEAIINKGYYFNELVSGKLIHAINTTDKPGSSIKLSQRETDFLKHACTEMTYKEIASTMYVSPRTVDGYRDDLFVKLNVKTRVGLVMYAIRQGVVEV